MEIVIKNMIDHYMDIVVIKKMKYSTMIQTQAGTEYQIIFVDAKQIKNKQEVLQQVKAKAGLIFLNTKSALNSVKLIRLC